MSAPYVLRLERPRRNAIDAEFLTYLDGELDRAAGAPILMQGTRDAFCAGLNLLYVSELDRAGLEDFLRAVDRVVLRLATYPGPTVALVEGHAIAGGAVLARACDHAVALDEPRVRIGVNEVALGVCFPPHILRLMAQRLPPTTLRRALLGADLHGPREALALGLVDEVSADPEPLARERLASFARHPAGAVALTKRALARALALDDEDEARFRLELREWSSEAVRARIRAVLGR